MQDPPWTNITISGGDIIETTGLIFAMLDQLGHSMNFTYTVVTPPDEQVAGVRKANGEWSGIIGQVVRNEVFMGAAALTISQDRNQVVNFSIPLDLQPYTLMFRRPQEQSKALLFIEPFKPLVIN